MIWSAQVTSQDIFEYYNMKIFDLNIEDNIEIFDGQRQSACFWRIKMF